MGLEAATLLVICPPAPDVAALQFGGSGYVYDPVTLWLATASLAERTIVTLPTDFRALIEGTYDPQQRRDRINAAENRQALVENESRQQVARQVRITSAHRVCIPPPSLSTQTFSIFGDDDENVRALTRDGDSQTLILVQWDGETAFPLDGSAPWDLNPASPTAWRVARELQDHSISVPAYPWERIERASRVCGETAAWDDWHLQFQSFARAAGLGEPVVIPVRRRGDNWGARVETNRRVRPIAYSDVLGLWFRKEESE